MPERKRRDDFDMGDFDRCGGKRPCTKRGRPVTRSRYHLIAGNTYKFRSRELATRPADLGFPLCGIT